MRFKSFTFFLVVLLSACGAPTPEPTPVSTATPTPLPTLSPTPVTPLAILVLPADMNEDQSKLYQTTVYDLTQAQGYRFQVRNSLTPGDRDPGLKVVIAVPPDPGVAQLAAAWPDVEFLAVNVPDIAPSGNVSTVASAEDPEISAFLGGYIAAMIAEDYHAGIITEKDTPGGTTARVAFTNGTIFYCGLCRGFFYLNYYYDALGSYQPLFVEVPTDAKANEVQAYANYLLDHKVDVVYVYPSLASADLLSFFATNGISMVGTHAPADPSVLPRWIASIQPDYIHAIQAAWPDLVAGKGGVSVPSPLTLGDVNSGLLTPGKLRLAQQVLDDLLAGRIAPGSQP